MNKRFFLSLSLISALATPVWAQSTAPASSPEWVNAEITRLQLDRNRVTLKHERIPSIKMDAMTMPFKLKEAKLFDGYKVGDKLQIVVKNDDGDLFITQVRKQPEAK
jgi:Cu(I)/Ag(I) efflux system periplasmic protein CusF